MAFRRRRFRGLGDLNTFVHVARVYVGGKTREKARIPQKALKALAGRMAAIAGGATAFRARGIYRSEAQPFVSEPSTVVETFVPAEHSCKKFRKQMQAIGSKAAKEGLQESIGVVVQCAGEPVRAVFATQRLKRRR
jgi:hypothetical protein